jgi:hypothetical protein
MWDKRDFPGIRTGGGSGTVMASINGVRGRRVEYVLPHSKVAGALKLGLISPAPEIVSNDFFPSVREVLI